MERSFLTLYSLVCARIAHSPVLLGLCARAGRCKGCPGECELRAARTGRAEDPAGPGGVHPRVPRGPRTYLCWALVVYCVVRMSAALGSSSSRGRRIGRTGDGTGLTRFVWDVPWVVDGPGGRVAVVGTRRGARQLCGDCRAARRYPGGEGRAGGRAEGERRGGTVRSLEIFGWFGIGSPVGWLASWFAGG